MHSDKQAKELEIENIEILQLIAESKYSRVYKARQLVLDRFVAVKVLIDFAGANLHELPEQEYNKRIERFRQEAKVTSGLKHPNIVKVLSFGVSGGGAPYMVLEYLEGQTLAEILAQKAAIPDAFIAEVFAQLLSALNYAHESGLLHRDLKPSNLMILRAESGETCVKIMDFGIAKGVFDANGSRLQNLTQSGSVLGTPAYMSPEQCRGERLDPGSDLYSLTCILYEMLCREPVFTAESAYELMLKHSAAPAPSAEYLTKKFALSKDISRLIACGLSKEKSRRPPSAGKFLEDFNAALAAGLRSSGNKLRYGRKTVFAAAAFVLFSFACICIGGKFFAPGKESQGNEKNGASSGAAENVVSEEARNISPFKAIKKGKSLREAKKYREALEYLEAAIKSLEGHIQKRDLLQAKFEAGRCCSSLYLQGRAKGQDYRKKGLTYFDQSIPEYGKLHYDDFIGGLKQAVILYPTSRLIKESESLISDGQKLWPDDEKAVDFELFVIRLLANRGFYAEARSLIEKAEPRYKAEGRAVCLKILRAYILVHEDRKDEAFELYRQLLSELPKPESTAGIGAALRTRIYVENLFPPLNRLKRADLIHSFAFFEQLKCKTLYTDSRDWLGALLREAAKIEVTLQQDSSAIELYELAGQEFRHAALIRLKKDGLTSEMVLKQRSEVLERLLSLAEKRHDMKKLAKYRQELEQFQAQAKNASRDLGQNAQ